MNREESPQIVKEIGASTFMTLRTHRVDGGKEWTLQAVGAVCTNSMSNMKRLFAHGRQ